MFTIGNAKKITNWRVNNKYNLESFTRWTLGLGLIQRIHKFRIKIRKSKESIFNTNTIIDKFRIKNKKNSS
jgi:hypothetical protein